MASGHFRDGKPFKESVTSAGPSTCAEALVRDPWGPLETLMMSVMCFVAGRA